MEQNKLNNSLFLNLHQAFAALSEVVQERLAASNRKLKLEQVPVLMSVYYQQEPCQQDIANYLKRDKSSVHRTIARLTQDNILSIVSDVDDKRKNKIYLTDQGKEMADNLHKELATMEDIVFNDFSSEEKKVLLNKLQQFAD